MGFFGKNKNIEETTQEKIEEEDTVIYEYGYECENCGDEDDIDIPIGTTADEFLKDKKCEFCGCNIIQKDKIKKIEEDK